MEDLIFDDSDLDLFRDASHDASPLHMSESFARRSPFSRRVVHGVLNLLAAVARVPRKGKLSSADIEFFSAAVAGVKYQVRVDDGADATVVLVSDGRRPVLEATLRFQGGGAPPAWPARTVAPTYTSAAKRSLTELSPGIEETGSWSPRWDKVRALLGRLGIEPEEIPPYEIAALLFVSYFVGMSIPGESAVLTRFSLRFGSGEPFDGVLGYKVRVEEIQESGELTLSADLGAAASGTISAFFRTALPFPSSGELIALGGQSESLRGKVALVTGGSRGLGAAIARALALHGARVLINFARSGDDAARVRDAILEAGGDAELLRGDAADVEWCRRAADTLERLDILVCNASPSIQPLWAEPASAGRAKDFVSESFAMMSVPTATFAPLLARAKGCIVLVSSAYVVESPAYFAHYVAAKSAAEAYLRMTIAQQRKISGLIVRPPKLLTEQTNSPAGRKGAMAPEIAAAGIAARLTGEPPSGLEILDSFNAPEPAGARR